MKIKTKGNRRMDEWLGGSSFADKIAICERGSNMTCLCCGYTIFDKEINEKWLKSQRNCPAHHFVENGYYLVLDRGFRGPRGVLLSESMDFPEQDVLDYFNRRS